MRPPLPGTEGEPPAEEPGGCCWAGGEGTVGSHLRDCPGQGGGSVRETGAALSLTETPARHHPPAGPGWRKLLERCWAEDPEQGPDFGCDSQGASATGCALPACASRTGRCLLAHTSSCGFTSNSLTPLSCRSVIEVELRGIAREVKRQQAPRRPAIPLPRAASRSRPAPPRQRQRGWRARGSGGLGRHGSQGMAARGGGVGGGAGRAAAAALHRPASSGLHEGCAEGQLQLRQQQQLANCEPAQNIETGAAATHLQHGQLRCCSAPCCMKLACLAKLKALLSTNACFVGLIGSGCLR